MINHTEKMKNMIFNCMAMVTLIALCGTVAAQDDEPKSRAILEEGLRYPEGSTPYRNMVLISNFGNISEFNPLNNEGKGYIAAIEGDKTRIFIPYDGNLSAPKGLLVFSGHLFIADVGKVVVYNLSKLEVKPQVIMMPEEELFVNDLVQVGDLVMVSVTNTGNLYGINASPSNMKALAEQQPRLMGNVPGANGMVVKDNILYIASYNPNGKSDENNVIYYIDITAPTTELKKLIPNQAPGLYDGITLSEDGNTIYFTSWGQDGEGACEVGLFAYDLDGKSSIRKIDVGAELKGPADITVKNGYLYLPDLTASCVYRLPM